MQRLTLMAASSLLSSQSEQASFLALAQASLARAPHDWQPYMSAPRDVVWVPGWATNPVFAARILASLKNVELTKQRIPLGRRLGWVLLTTTADNSFRCGYDLHRYSAARGPSTLSGRCAVGAVFFGSPQVSSKVTLTPATTGIKASMAQLRELAPLVLPVEQVVRFEREYVFAKAPHTQVRHLSPLQYLLSLLSPEDCASLTRAGAIRAWENDSRTSNLVLKLFADFGERVWDCQRIPTLLADVATPSGPRS